MCELIFCSPSLQDARRLFEDNQCTVVCEAVPPSAEENAQPYAFHFTVQIAAPASDGWKGWLAFDLLRRPGSRWSPLEEAHRFVCDLIAPPSQDAENKLYRALRAVAATAADVDLAKLDRQLEADVVPEAVFLAQELHRLTCSPILQSRRAEFTCLENPKGLIDLRPTEFHVYASSTLVHDRHDYSGCIGPQLIRVVSKEGAAHRILAEFRPRTIGARECDPESLANWFTRYLTTKCGLKPEGLPSRWRIRIWEELTGKTEAQHDLDAWSATSTENLPLRILIGRESASGLGIPVIQARYSEIIEITVRNSLVQFLTVDHSRSQPVLAHILVYCRKSMDADALAGALERRELRTLGRNTSIVGIAACFGQPRLNAIASIGDRGLREKIIAEFRLRHPSRQIKVVESKDKFDLYLHPASCN